MLSAYSPFFTSGLLSAEASLSRPPSPLTRRISQASLPNDSPASTLLASCHQSSTVKPTAYYYTQQSNRNMEAQRSFLSLDLAESKSLCSASQKRVRSTSKWSSWSSKPATIYAPSLSPTTRRHRRPAPIKTTLPTVGELRSPVTALRSARNIPSPKPVPDAILPSVPLSGRSAPRLPSIPFTPPLHLSAIVPKRRVSQSTFSISTRCRIDNRSDALAALEGRKQAPAPRVDRKHTRGDFMIMSDEEDDDQEGRGALSEQRTLTTKSAAADTVEPSPPSKVSHKTTRPSADCRKRKKRATADSWLPLGSFIDLKEEDNWKWPSFIEITNA